MGQNWNYTQVLSLISAQIQRLENKLDGVEDKLTADHGRITKLESESSSNWRWVGWAGWAFLAVMEIYRTYQV